VKKIPKCTLVFPIIEEEKLVVRTNQQNSVPPKHIERIVKCEPVI